MLSMKVYKSSNCCITFSGHMTSFLNICYYYISKHKKGTEDKERENKNNVKKKFSSITKIYYFPIRCK